MKNITKYSVVMILILVCVVYLFTRCPYLNGTSGEKSEETENVKVTTIQISDEIRKKVSGMTLEEKLYQMFYITPEQLTGVGEVIQAGETTKEKLGSYPVGGIVYSSHNLQTPEQTRELLQKTQGYSKIPMFLGVFEEGGTVTAIGDNEAMSLQKTEPMAEVKDFDRAYEIGKHIGEELYALGFNMNFAPVTDVMGEQNENVIGKRSFGTDYNSVAGKVEQYVKGMQESGISATLKHFPGQGYTTGGTDSSYAVNDRSEKEIRNEEFSPFIRGIEVGADFIMLGNVKAPKLDAENPATFSYKIVTEILKKELGYSGIVISAPLNDGAVLNSHTSAEAAVEAVKAGVDMILMPNNMVIAYEALYDEVKKGKIPESQIDESVMKILQCKADNGLMK